MGCGVLAKRLEAGRFPWPAPSEARRKIALVPEAVRTDPPQLFKREIVRLKFRHSLDRNKAPLLAPAPKCVVAGGFASAGLIAWALTAKYCNHLPLYRQERCSRARAHRSHGRNGACDWVGAATALLEPLTKRVNKPCCKAGTCRSTESPIRCNDPDLRDGKTTQGWL